MSIGISRSEIKLLALSLINKSQVRLISSHVDNMKTLSVTIASETTEITLPNPDEQQQPYVCQFLGIKG